MFQIALKQSKITNVIDTEEVFDTGCYVLGPDTKFVYFQSTAHDVVESISVFTKDTITVGIQFSAHYFIRYSILMCVLNLLGLETLISSKYMKNITWSMILRFTSTCT